MLFWVTREASKSTKLKNIYFKFYFHPVYANPYTLKYMCTGICVCVCAHTWTYMQWATRLSMLILLLLWSCGGWELIKSLLLLTEFSENPAGACWVKPFRNMRSDREAHPAGLLLCTVSLWTEPPVAALKCGSVLGHASELRLSLLFSLSRHLSFG